MITSTEAPKSVTAPVIRASVAEAVIADYLTCKPHLHEVSCLQAPHIDISTFSFGGQDTKVKNKRKPLFSLILRKGYLPEPKKDSITARETPTMAERSIS